MARSVVKATVAVMVAAMAVSGCAGHGVLAGSGRTAKCWLGEVAGPGFGNVLSICAKGDVALLSNHFRNPGGFPTTCDSDGIAKALDKGDASFSFQPGMCDNGRTTGALALTCREDSRTTLACRFVPERNLVGEFKFTRFSASTKT
jgi:hypothetical protein